LVAHYLSVKRIFKNKRNALSLEESKNLFQFGGWMTVSNLIGPIMVVADRFLIANFFGAAVVAFYTIPAEFMIRLLVLPAAITTTLFPIFSKYISENNYADAFTLYRKSLRIIFLMMGAITICVILGANFGLQLWLGPVFAEKSTLLASVLMVGILFNSMALVPHAYIQASGDARSTALIHVFESVFYIPTLLLLMKTNGILGAAIAWMLRALLDLVLLNSRAMRKKT
jgi:O-antigen/teichoic acid export membrane protein